MNYTIENESFVVSVNEIGAELTSIRSKKTDKEYIWQANPEIWGSSAPVLFPNIGNLKDGEYKLGKKTYQLPRHGFIRNNDKVKLINKTPTRLSFVFSSNEETLAMYPFVFDIKISFFLLDNRLQVFHEIINLNKDDMFFSLGGHPAFNCPWSEGEDYEDYYIEFSAKENASIARINPAGLLSKKEIPFLEDTKKLPLKHELFEKDALIFPDLSSGELTIKSKKNKTTLTVNFEDFPFLGIWAKPNGNFICIEPWHGLPDYENSDKEMTTKPGIVKLTADNTHYASYAIQIIEK